MTRNHLKSHLRPKRTPNDVCSVKSLANRFRLVGETDTFKSFQADRAKAYELIAFHILCALTNRRIEELGTKDLIAGLVGIESRINALRENAGTLDTLADMIKVAWAQRLERMKPQDAPLAQVFEAGETVPPTQNTSPKRILTGAILGESGVLIKDAPKVVRPGRKAPTNPRA